MPWPPIIITCRKAPWTWNLIHTTKVLVWNLNMKVTKISCSGLYLWRTVHAPCQLPYNTSFRGPVSEGLHYANPSKRFKKEIQIPPPPKKKHQKNRERILWWWKTAKRKKKWFKIPERKKTLEAHSDIFTCNNPELLRGIKTTNPMTYAQGILEDFWGSKWLILEPHV